jgi:hypothetical protein
MAFQANGITARTRMPLEFERKLHGMEALLSTFEQGSELTPYRNSLVARASRRLAIIAEVMTGEPPRVDGWRGALAAMRGHLESAVARWKAHPEGERLREVEIIAEQIEHATNVVRDLLRDYAVYLDPGIAVKLRGA